MLRANLATRPFYNDHAVRVAIGVAILLVAALTLFNMARIVTLNGRNAERVAAAEASELRANRLREQARKTRETLDASDAAQIQASAREANLLIERRAFSWTELFNRLEETLPADVRVGAVQPQVDTDGRMLIVATVYSRRVEDLDLFIDQLEKTAAFSKVLSRQDDREEDGTLRSVLQGYYHPERAAKAPPATSESQPTAPPGNGTSGAPASDGGAQ
jgi:hypothetical protein